ncbi:MAG: hypothetical protein Q4C49_14080 [Bacillota bacterium]|nr:hypothetical protein [Bacillota bacterium]
MKKKKYKIIFWILGWIFCFPIPLSLIIYRSSLKKEIKITLLVLLWSLILFGVLLDITGLSKPNVVSFFQAVTETRCI